MILFPLKTKFRKSHKAKGRFKGFDKKCFLPSLGNFYALKVLNVTRITNQQLEAARRIIRKRLKKKFMNFLRVKILTDLIVTKKSSGVRMGKGKGDFNFWAFVAKKGRLIFELNKNIPKSLVKNALTAGAFKFSNKCYLIKKYKTLE